jgi:hypothetical protein
LEYYPADMQENSVAEKINSVVNLLSTGDKLTLIRYLAG